MGTYIARSLKYFVQLTVLFAIVFGAMKLLNAATTDSLADVFLSARGLLMLGTIVVLAALYPTFGFVRREIAADLADDRDKILRAMEMGDYRLESEEDGRMVFRAASPVKRIVTLGEDALTVRRKDRHVVVGGLRKEVVKVEYRLKSMI